MARIPGDECFFEELEEFHCISRDISGKHSVFLGKELTFLGISVCYWGL